MLSPYGRHGYRVCCGIINFTGHAAGKKWAAFIMASMQYGPHQENMDKNLIIVEDEETLCESLKRVLSREGYSVDTASSSESALEMMSGRVYDLIITDIILPGINGIEFLRMIKEKNPEQIVVVMTAYASLETAVEALRAGAFDYIVKPVMHEEIKQIVKNAIKQKTLQSENTMLRCQVEQHYDIETLSLYKSPSIQHIIDDIKKQAADRNVLLTGETGTEKDLLAKFVHMCIRPSRPFVILQCSDTNTEHIRKQLFDVSGGVLFLKDIQSMNREFQEIVTEFFRSGECRVVSSCPKSVITQTAETAPGGDLLQQLSGFTVDIPPLRERTEDIGPLAHYFAQKYSDEFCRSVSHIDSEAMKLLLSHSWPGNTRELQNTIERAVLLSDSDTIRKDHLALISGS